MQPEVQQQEPWEMPSTGNAASEDERGDDYEGVSREELIASMREAGGAESADVDAEEAAAAAPKPAPAKEAPAPAAKPEPAVDPDEPKIASVIRARAEAQRKRDEAQDHAAKVLAEAQAEATKLREEARQKALADYEAELQQRRAKFRESPTSAIRELGFDTNKVVEEVVREGTPEWQALRAMQQELEAAKSKAGVAEKVATEFEAFKKAQQEREERAYVEQVKQTYLSTHASTEKTPYLHKRFDAEEIFERSNRLAAQWQQAGIEFAHEDVAQYLEFESRKRILGSDGASTPQQVSGAAGKPAGSAPKVKANGPRTLSAATGSERRTSPKPIREMTAEEERDALVAEVAEMRRKMGPRDTG